jgi:hypothetical protein
VRSGAGDSGRLILHLQGIVVLGSSSSQAQADDGQDRRGEDARAEEEGEAAASAGALLVRQA